MNGKVIFSAASWVSRRDCIETYLATDKSSIPLINAGYLTPSLQPLDIHPPCKQFIKIDFEKPSEKP
jgi:hypothetical protein